MLSVSILLAVWRMGSGEGEISPVIFFIIEVIPLLKTF